MDNPDLIHKISNDGLKIFTHWEKSKLIADKKRRKLIWKNVPSQYKSNLSEKHRI